MFENLTDRLRQATRKIRGQAYLREDNINDALRDVRLALLEADVALPVVKSFIDSVKERASGRAVVGSLMPGQAFIKVVQDELTTLLGQQNQALDLNAPAPVVILLVGLQGSGKTTSAAKLALHLQERVGKKVLLASTDVYRPAAMAQLETLAAQVKASYFPAGPDEQPVAIAQRAKRHASTSGTDVLVIDTAGRSQIDELMMLEIAGLHAALDPIETLFVVDAMSGQDAANTAAAFARVLPLTGVILTKADGDARGGAALSVKQVTGKPIKFIGVGEKPDALEPFYPQRMASRILGMGDVVGLVEEVERKVDKDRAQQMGRKLAQGKGFTLEDFREQLKMIDQLGGFGSMLDKLPGMPGLPSATAAQVDARQLSRLAAIIDSMTRAERRYPDIVRGSRKRRIAGGAGVQIQDVSRLLKQFGHMQKTMKKIGKKGGMNQVLRGMTARSGSLPFGKK